MYKLKQNLLDLFEFTLSKGDQKKIEIIKACIELVSTVGIEKTSFESISKVIGTNRSHIKYYYNSKDDLFIDCYKFIIGTYQDYSLKSLSKIKLENKMLDAYLNGYFCWAKENRSQVSAMLLLYYQCTHNSHFRQINQAIKVGGAKKIQYILSDSLKLKLSKSKLEILSRGIQALLSSCVIDIYTFETKDICFEKKEKETKKLIKVLIKNTVEK